MKKQGLIYAVVAALVMCFLAGLPVAAKTPLPPPDYFPLVPGYWWTYKNVEKGWEFTIKVVGMEKIGNANCYKVETMAADGKVSFVEYYTKDTGKVFVIRQEFPSAKMSVDYNPIREFLHNPPKVGDSWNWKGKGMMDVDIDDTITVLEDAKVEVPAGKFSAAKVVSKVIQGGSETNKTYWYAPNVGLVKSFTDTGSVKSTMELVKYNLKAKK
jgi:hypothetical protein